VAAVGAQKQPALKNLSAIKWTVTEADGKQTIAKPGQSVALKKGTKISFGKCEAEIRI